MPRSTGSRHREASREVRFSGPGARGVAARRGILRRISVDVHFKYYDGQPPEFQELIGENPLNILSRTMALVREPADVNGIVSLNWRYREGDKTDQAAYDSGTGRGWRADGAAKRWIYTSGSHPTEGIVSTLQLAASRKRPDWIDVTLKGRGGIHPAAIVAPPRMTIVLDPQANICGETTFSAGSCRVPRTGRSTSCRS